VKIYLYSRGKEEIKMHDMNSGYHGFSMSNRAYEAHENGEKPLSSWTKQLLVETIQEVYGVDASKCTADYLRQEFLRGTGWHHTGVYCNKTDFYAFEDGLDKVWVEYLITQGSSSETRQKKTPTQVQQKVALVRFYRWEGTKAHLRRIWKVGVGTWTEKNGKPSKVSIYLESTGWPETKLYKSIEVLNELKVMPGKDDDIWERCGDAKTLNKRRKREYYKWKEHYSR
jgi:hypothetical protein